MVLLGITVAYDTFGLPRTSELCCVTLVEFHDDDAAECHLVEQFTCESMTKNLPAIYHVGYMCVAKWFPATGYSRMKPLPLKSTVTSQYPLMAPFGAFNSTMSTIRPLLRCKNANLRLRQLRGLATTVDATRHHAQEHANHLGNDHVRIVEVGPRDGLQNEKKSIPLTTKIELIERLSRTGLTDIEAGSFVAAKWVPQVSSDTLPCSLVLYH